MNIVYAYSINFDLRLGLNNAILNIDGESFSVRIERNKPRFEREISKEYIIFVDNNTTFNFSLYDVEPVINKDHMFMITVNNKGKDYKDALLILPVL